MDDLQRLYEENESELQESQKKYGGVYVARIEADDGLDLEVELDQGNIAFTLRYETASFLDGSTPEDRYQELVDFLESNEISVFEDHDDWEEALAMEEE